MLEQYIYNLITGDSTLQTLLSAGGGKYHLYPTVIPSGVLFSDVAVTFTLVTTFDAFPTVESKNYQFNIFAKTHAKTAQVSQALANLFNGDNLKTSGGAKVVFSIRASETDLGYNFDTKNYQRETTYDFKLR